MITHRRAAFIVRVLVRSSSAFGVVAALGCASEAPPANSPDSPPPGPVATGHDVHEKGGASVFVVHEVKDFDAFKKFLDEGEAERKQMNVFGHILTRLDDGRVVVHFFAHDIKEVDAALKSPRMEDYFQREGAPDSSLVWLVRDEVVVAPARPLEGRTFSLFLKLKTTDFATFKKSFEDHASVYAEQGVVAYGLHRSTVQDETIILHFVGTDHDKLGALATRPELVELLRSGGGATASKPLLGEDVARSPYR
jgi:hypothetical protein